MNRLSKVFSGGKAFIPFITAGDPSITVTEQLIYSMYEAGADLVEIGIPFSDPVAEGPVIQAADERALAAGVTVDDVFSMMERVRKSCDVPVALMTYVNGGKIRYGKVHGELRQGRDRCGDSAGCAFEERTNFFRIAGNTA